MPTKRTPISFFLHKLLLSLSGFVLLFGIQGTSRVYAQTASPTPASPPRSPWAWPAIPACLADPEIQTPGQTDYASPVCPLYSRLLASGEFNIELRSARRLNAEMDRLLYPAFVPGTEVVTFITTERFTSAFTGATGLVRVSTRAVSARTGSWWTTLDTVTEGGKLLDADAIRMKLALPTSPACLAYADAVTPGVRAYMGVVAPAFDQRGGGVEFWFPPNAVSAKNTKQILGGATCDTV